MRSTVLALSLSALAAAAPHKAARQVPNYPPVSYSQGFRLIANVTDPSKDFTPSINGWAFQAYHTGAGFNQAVLHAIDDEYPGALLYENGTATDVRYSAATIIMDAGTPHAPYAVQVQAADVFDTPANPTLHATYVDIGKGTVAEIAQFPTPYPTLVSGTGSGQFVACNSTIPYYSSKFITVDYAYATFTAPDGSYEYNANIPDGCVPIALVPQCAVLPDLPEGSYSSHEFAYSERCYDDVSAIEWSQYGP